MKRANAASSGVVRTLRLCVLLIVAMALLGSSVLGCHKKGDAAAEPAPDAPALTDATTGLLLTWIDDKGEFHVEQKSADVPAAGRDAVKVRDPARDPLSGNRIFVADLRAAAPDGSYPVHVADASEFEDIAVTRRAQHGVVLAPREAGASPAGSGATPGEVAGRPAVIIYGASWCGPCHQAAAYLKDGADGDVGCECPVGRGGSIVADELSVEATNVGAGARGTATGALAISAEALPDVVGAELATAVRSGGDPPRIKAHVATPSTMTTNTSAPTNVDTRLGAGAARGTVVRSTRCPRGFNRTVSRSNGVCAAAIGSVVDTFDDDGASCALGGRCGSA